MSDQYNFSARCQFVADQASMTKLATDLKNTLNTAGATNVKVKVDLDKASAGQAISQIRQIKTATDDLTASMSKFGEMTGIAGRRFAAFSTATMGIFALVGAIKNATSEAIAFDTALNKLEQVSGQTYRQVSALAQETMNLGQKLGVSMKELMGAVVTFKQAGMNLNEVRDAMKAVAATNLAPNFESITQTTEGAIAVFQQFGKESKNLYQQLGAMNAVAGEFAVEAGDLVTAAQKAGGAFSVLGGSLEELLGLFTSVRSTTRESAESIATGMRTIFSRLQRHDTVESLKDLNIHLRYTREEAEQMNKTEIAGQFVGAYEAVRRLSEGLKGLQNTDARYTNVIEQLGGQRQISRVIPLLQQFGEAQKAINVAKVGGISLQINEEQSHKRIENRISKVREEYQKLFNEMGQTSQVQKLVDAFETVAMKIAKVTENLGPLVTTLASFGVAKIVKELPNFTRGVMAGPQHGPLARKSSGGPIMGSGVGDNVSAVLEPGEFVLNKQAARNIGYGRLEQVNNRQRQRYADGGQVRPYHYKHRNINPRHISNLGGNNEFDLGVLSPEEIPTLNEVVSWRGAQVSESRRHDFLKQNKFYHDEASQRVVEEALGKDSYMPHLVHHPLTYKMVALPGIPTETAELFKKTHLERKGLSPAALGPSGAFDYHMDSRFGGLLRKISIDKKPSSIITNKWLKNFEDSWSDHFLDDEVLGVNHPKQMPRALFDLRDKRTQSHSYEGSPFYLPNIDDFANNPNYGKMHILDAGVNTKTLAYMKAFPDFMEVAKRTGVSRQGFASGGLVKTLGASMMGGMMGLGVMGGTSMTAEPNMLELADGSLMGAAAGAASRFASPILSKLKDYLKGRIQFPKRHQPKGIDAEILPDISPEQQEMNAMAAMNRKLYKIGGGGSGADASTAAAEALAAMGVDPGISIIKRNKPALPAPTVYDRKKTPTYDTDVFSRVLKTAKASYPAKYNKVRLTSEEIARAIAMREEGYDHAHIAMEMSTDERIVPIHRIKAAMKRKGYDKGGEVSRDDKAFNLLAKGFGLTAGALGLGVSQLSSQAGFWEENVLSRYDEAQTELGRPFEKSQEYIGSVGGKYIYKPVTKDWSAGAVKSLIGQAEKYTDTYNNEIHNDNLAGIIGLGIMGTAAFPATKVAKTIGKGFNTVKGAFGAFSNSEDVEEGISRAIRLKLTKDSRNDWSGDRGKGIEGKLLKGWDLLGDNKVTRASSWIEKKFTGLKDKIESNSFMDKIYGIDSYIESMPGKIGKRLGNFARSGIVGLGMGLSEFSGNPLANNIIPKPKRAGFAKGDFVGPSYGGIPGKDSVDASLMPGEFVIKKDSVDKIGVEKLRQVNQTGRIGFADGDLVPKGPTSIRQVMEKHMSPDVMEIMVETFSKQFANLVKKQIGFTGMKAAGALGGDTSGYNGAADVRFGINHERKNNQGGGLDSLLKLDELGSTDKDAFLKKLRSTVFNSAVQSIDGYSDTSDEYGRKSEKISKPLQNRYKYIKQILDRPGFGNMIGDEKAEHLSNTTQQLFGGNVQSVAQADKLIRALSVQELELRKNNEELKKQNQAATNPQSNAAAPPSKPPKKPNVATGAPFPDDVWGKGSMGGFFMGSGIPFDPNKIVNESSMFSNINKTGRMPPAPSNGSPVNQTAWRMLQKEARDLGINSSGTKEQLQQKIAEYRQGLITGAAVNPPKPRFAASRFSTPDLIGDFGFNVNNIGPSGLPGYYATQADPANKRMPYQGAAAKELRKRSLSDLAKYEFGGATQGPSPFSSTKNYENLFPNSGNRPGTTPYLWQLMNHEGGATSFDTPLVGKNQSVVMQQFMKGLGGIRGNAASGMNMGINVPNIPFKVPSMIGSGRDLLMDAFYPAGMGGSSGMSIDEQMKAEKSKNGGKFTKKYLELQKLKNSGGLNPSRGELFDFNSWEDPVTQARISGGVAGNGFHMIGGDAAKTKKQREADREAIIAGQDAGGRSNAGKFGWGYQGQASRIDQGLKGHPMYNGQNPLAVHEWAASIRASAGDTGADGGFNISQLRNPKPINYGEYDLSTKVNDIWPSMFGGSDAAAKRGSASAAQRIAKMNVPLEGGDVSAKFKMGNLAAHTAINYGTYNLSKKEDTIWPSMVSGSDAAAKQGNKQALDKLANMGATLQGGDVSAKLSMGSLGAATLASQAALPAQQMAAKWTKLQAGAPTNGLIDIVNGNLGDTSRVSAGTGGRLNFSEKDGVTGGGTKATKELTEEMKKLRSGIYEQVRSYGMSRTEAVKTANELAHAAVNNNLAVNSSGGKHYLGADSLMAAGRSDLALEATHGMLTGKGPGGGGGGGGWFGRKLDQLANWKNNLPENSFRKNMMNPTAMAIGGSVLTGYAAQTLNPSDETTRNVGNSTGAEKSYKEGRIVSSAMEYAGIGLATGSAFGAKGAVVGTIAGAGYGIYSGIKDADKEIKQIKTSNAVEGIGQDLDFYNKGLKKFEDLSGSEFESRAGVIRGNARSSAFSASDGFLSGPSTDDLSKNYSKEIRLSAGGQLFPMMNQVNMRAQEMGRQQYLTDDSGMKNEEKADFYGKNLMKEGVTAANVSLLVDLGAYKTTNEAVRALGEEFIKAKNSEIKRKKGEETSQQTERFITSMGRMVDMVDKAAQGTEGFSRKLSLIESGTAPMKDISSVLGNIGMNSEGSLKSATDFFNNSGATQFSDSLNANEKFAKLLPDALIGVNSGGYKDEDIGNQLRSSLLRGVGAKDSKDLSSPEKAVLDNIIKEFGEMVQKDRGSVSNAVGGDVTGFSRSLMGNTANPLIKFATEYQKGISNLEQMIDRGFNTAAGFKAAGAGYRVAAAETGLQSVITANRFARGEAGALDGISIGQLNEPFNLRMNKFGAGGMNVGQIGQGFRDAENAKEAALKNKESLRGRDGYMAAEQSFQGLVQKSNDLTGALKALAEGTKTAAASMKLASINSSLDSRRGYAQQFITADWETKAKMTRQQNMVKSLGKNGEGFENMGWEHKGEVVNALSSMGQLTLPNGVRADEMLKRVTDKVLPGGMQEEEKSEQKKAQEAVKQALKEQADAQNELAKLYEEKNDKFLGGLKGLFDSFLDGLNRGRLQAELSTFTQLKAGLSPQIDKNAKEKEYAATLKDKFGIDSDQKVEVARGQLGKLSELAQLNSEISTLDQQKLNEKNSAHGILKNINGQDLIDGTGKLANIGRGDRATKTLEMFNFDDSGLPNEVKDLLLSKVAGNEAKYGSAAQGAKNFSNSTAGKKKQEASAQEYLRLYVSDLQSSIKEINDAKGATRGGIIGGTTGPNPTPGLTGFGGMGNANTLLNLDQAGVDAARKALGAFNSGNTLSGLSDRDKKTQDSLDNFTKAMEEVTKKINALPLPVTKAGGGSIGMARGTDTVPAMLTPGEFIVSADKAAKNKGLLEHINKGGKATYLALGGMAGADGMGGGVGLGPTMTDFAWSDIKRDKKDKEEAKKKAAFDNQTDKMLGNIMLNKDMAKFGFENEGAMEQIGERDFNGVKVPMMLAKGARGAKQNFANTLITNEQNDFTRRGLSAIAYSGPEMDAGQAAVFKGAADERASRYGAGGRREALADQLLSNKFDRNEAIAKANLGNEIRKGQNNQGAKARLDAQRAHIQNIKNKDEDLNAVTLADKIAAFHEKADAVGIWGMGATSSARGLLKRAAGGPVPGMGMGDKIPMLAEPGEYVINAKAAQQYGQGNLAQINNGGNQGGAGVGGNQLASAIMEFNQKAGNISTAFSVFGANVDKLVAVMEKFPQNIEMTGNVTHTHTHNGAEVWGEVRKMLEQSATEIANKAIDDRVPGANMRNQS